MSYIKKALALVLLTAFALSFAKADLVELNPENFKPIVHNPNKNVFVMFYAPWCGHCNHMKPEWQSLADKYSVDTDDTVIARVDASAHMDVAKDNNVDGFPTLKLFTKTNKAGLPYTGPREVDAFEAFLKQNVE
ncbi:putative mitochondrial Protein disulfide isomerase [Leptomonas pyrrhocoris]|uniref:Putative mitochondrial Protein disulfide isomerase n=1 Tax=Leptomonas pyrrhocoris TaxID=157538 RepID=A0A0M9G760_LEPPY|nr:putative mitochondrial Protein disulfide isomerase [Leptomonas pyrrhocoris]XP_015662165.1 putative mitochondrial Protein disulfide isomerase [Leptomonas pyrrhocoris]XP_015662166.1 putative mitochondrial Protein disulfide isomerase [Leptomonas pyrrhocoris]XP_015662167.1 putative mitochondrial Protein disulfide isomerase [Leptomonas pyrrhocoris]KPA83725.1 putative mitochondrial Protein disulfide isomerase [Leptomonas pyrrhocoris]KPA83726.1 putative mitochondrial Protein disulfide isomerase [L|eukprot:XP_015662164.1 putative mitochondrial Protein disulfide isomerase [Leptomonas pyrrhocoris]